MKKELRKITNLTINELLNNEIIMPSVYFEKFNKNARTLEVNLEDEEFIKELNETMLEDFNSIENYMNVIEKNASHIKQAAQDTKEALVNKDLDALTTIYNQMHQLEDELQNLNKKLFIDDLTNAQNRKWIYNKFLDKDSCFKEDGVISLIDIVDYSYLEKEYGTLIADNLLIFIVNFIRRHLKDDKCEFQIARFVSNKFLIFFSDKNEKDVRSLINNTKRLLENTTLKSNSGLIIKANYEYKLKEYKKEQDSKELFESLFSN